jgi:hypothetical protein
MASRLSTRRERFARNWKLIGIPSKSKWQGSLLHNRIVSKTMSRMFAKFQAQTIDIIENVCYELGKEDACQLMETLKINEHDARSCLEPIEMMCLLNGIDAEIISKTKNTASLTIKSCPFNDVLIDTVPNIFVCKNYFTGMAQIINPNAKLMQPQKKCEKDEECEYVISTSI